ncbi:MAG: peptide chain release factor N(5)-glutamine methyltransferase [Deltaproteobacteria bacterium]|nr:peptide chain release factor N(5)-glutamine methyltransferase [Deltaproteobacteria bacterium]
MATLRATLTELSARLTKAGIDSPRLSAEVLVAFALGLERPALMKELIMNPESAIPWSCLARIEDSARRRENGEPVAYITGVKEFYGRDFTVSPATLIPRPETETLVDAALAFAQKYTPPSGNPAFADLGTGSGAIAVTVALELPSWSGTAVDISPDALRVAARNARALRAENLAFVLCDFLGPELPRGPYDMVLANPPYVSEEEYGTLSPEVARFEPKSALVPPFTGSGGLEHLFGILDAAERLLTAGGLLLLEMGRAQGDALMAKAGGAPFLRDCRILNDLAGSPRVFHAIRA